MIKTRIVGTSFVLLFCFEMFHAAPEGQCAKSVDAVHGHSLLQKAAFQKQRKRVEPHSVLLEEGSALRSSSEGKNFSFFTESTKTELRPSPKKEKKTKVKKERKAKRKAKDKGEPQPKPQPKPKPKPQPPEPPEEKPAPPEEKPAPPEEKPAPEPQPEPEPPKEKHKTGIKEKDARFLIQATFGPTRKSMEDFHKFESYEAWIKSQMDLPIGSHREYYRARANPRGAVDPKEPKVGNPRSKCDKGSRWLGFAFSKKDAPLGEPPSVKELTFKNGQIFVDGKLRTGIKKEASKSTCTDKPSSKWAKARVTCKSKIARIGKYCQGTYWKENKICQQTCFDAGHGYEGDDCGGGWLSMKKPMYICSVEDKVDGVVKLSSKDDCTNQVPALNPPVWFASPPKGSVTSLMFETLRPDVIVLAEDAGDCQLGDFVRPDTGAKGQYYHHDVRLALLENTLEHPHAVAGMEGKACSAVPKTFLNEKSCQLLPGCTPLSEQSVRVTLNKDALKKIHAEGRHVYVARGISSHENNVYDFSEWVLKHPAKALPHIKKFVSNEVELKFTQWDEMERWEVYVGKYGETLDFSDLPQPLQTQGLADAFGAVGKSGKLEVVCGSPGEVANNPMKGNQVAFYSVYGNSKKDPLRVFQDNRFDKTYSYGVPNNFRASTWLMQAIYGHDQLRQRMSWALAQIFVVGTNSGGSHLNEAWINYYDIFVRNAFGNFKDLLREVTYSKVMGDYLTFKGNKKFDDGGNYPDENYAREIMQLFSIGLWKLNPDGSRKKDDEGNDVPTYSNDQIMNMARVFTGFDEQQGRTNVETSKGYPNHIDPMRMQKLWHDPYPKPDLDGNFLGDGYPLCADMPAEAFLAKGAKYIYIGDAHNGPEVFVPSSKSDLFSALCRKRGERCSFKYIVELSETLECEGDECEIDAVKIVKVESGDQVGFYEFVPPACVHLFFFNGKEARKGSSRHFSSQKKCMNPDQLSAGVSCCGGCSNKPDNALTRRKKSCDDLTDSYLKQECSSKSWKDKKICARSCSKAGMGYPGLNCAGGKERQEKRICAYKGEKVRFDVAFSICKKHGLEVCPQSTTDASTSCGYDDDLVWAPFDCALEVNVESDGKVSYLINSQAKKNPFAVQWDGDFPVAKAGSCPSGCTVSGESCICKAQIETTAVFDKVPSKEALLEKLKIGAFPPSKPCTLNCKSEVRGFIESGTQIDERTVFEHHGKFYRNIKVLVRVGSGQGSFRNPPTFMEYNVPRARDAHAEVDSFLDHLLEHPNTPMHIGRLLIQRLVTSNPSPKFIQDVGEAFRSGSYDGTEYSGQYGDLGATLAAILLHPEARQLDHSNRNNGRLREPLLKIVHFMRSMEYKDDKGREIIMKDLLDEIGQWPYEPDSVFNFYLPDFEPDRFSKGLVAPEFQIFTPPLAMSFLNGMISLVKNGLQKRDGGFGENGKGSDGKLTFKESGTVNETMTELNLLLTGGRLKSSMGTVLKAYEKAKAKNQDGLKAAQEIILMSPEFNTMGDSRPAGKRKPVVKKTPPPARDYKAVIMLFFDGGADTFNLLVPQNCDHYKEYVQIRKNVALRPNEVQKIKTIGQECKEFGIHAKFDFVKKLYDQKKVAFASNVGSLAEPMTPYQFKRGGAKKCSGLFSHADMQTNAQTLHCQVAGRAPKGFGGRLADALGSGSKKYATTSFSVAGTKVWSQGFDTRPQIISRKQGSVRLVEYANLKGSIDNLTSTQHDSIYCEEYAKSLAESVESTEEMGEILKHVKLKTKYEADPLKIGNGKLNEQFRQVARLVASREERKAERDFFFVTIGGFDTHSKVTEILDAKYTETDEALRVFVTEMEAQKVFDKLTIVTHSDFARTLSPNGNQGTDHAWAGNHMIISGDLKGGRVFNKYPKSLLTGNEQDAGRGRLIPKYPWESMLVPVAEWMGMESSKSSHVFPNLGNFNSTLIIPTSELFK